MMYMSIAGMMILSMLQGAFTIDDNGQALKVSEDGKPVLSYHYEFSELPQRVPERYRRAGYIHPLYGLDGEVMTQDYPIDHRHHRGVFWAWPDSTLGDKRADIWLLDGIRSVHAEWVEKKAEDDKVVIAAKNHWVYDDAPDKPVMTEAVRFVVHPATEKTRAIDFEVTFTNVTEDVFTIRGALTDNKGYGGFCLRPDATRKPFQFTSVLGKQEPEVDNTDDDFPSPWVDISFATEKDGDTFSGMATFQHPDNPGYPHNKWILRHYGFLGHSWPHIKGYELQPGASVTMRYRLFIHRNDAETANVAGAFEQYENEMK
jgi:hypothetical protein